MIKIWLLSSNEERCGIAEYGNNLKTHVLAEDNIQFVDKEYDSDIVNVNYEPGLHSWVNEDLVRIWKQHGKKTLLTLHTSHSGNNRSNFTNAFDRVMVHEKTQDGFTYVPMGIPNSGIQSNIIDLFLIGTFGFPFPKKGFHQVAQAAELLGKTLKIIAPTSRHFDTDAMEKCCKEANPSCIYLKDWCNQREVIFKLSSNLVNVFAYNGNDLGISAAVRLALAAKRPIVLTRDRQFNDLFDYEDEIEFVDSNDPKVLADGVNRVLENGKQPNRVCNELSWKISAEKYVQIYRELMNN